LLCGRLVLAAESDKAYTLDDAVTIALQNDARLLSAQQDRIIAEERVREAKYLFLPEFGLQASATKFDSRYPFSLSHDFRNILLFPGASENIYSGRGYMTMSIYEGKRTLNTLRLAQAAQKQATSSYESVRMDILQSVKTVFYRVLLAQERLAAAEQARAAADSTFAGARLDAWERIEAEALLGQTNIRAAEAAHELDLSRLAFLKALNLELDTPFRLIGSLETRPLDVARRNAVLWAMELRPELQAETYKAEMDAIAVNLAMSRRIPTIFVAGDYELTAQRFPLRNNNWAASLGIRIPFSYDYFTQIRQKRAEQRQGQLKRASLQDQVRLEVRESLDTLQHWAKELPLREAQYRKVQALYDQAAGSQVLPRVRALLGVLDLRLAYLAATTELILAQAHLERAVGRELAP
jgi:outer membrane protein TolC